MLEFFEVYKVIFSWNISIPIYLSWVFAETVENNTANRQCPEISHITDETWTGACGTFSCVVTFLLLSICLDRLSPCLYILSGEGDSVVFVSVYCCMACSHLQCGVFKDGWQQSLCPCNPCICSEEMLSSPMSSLGCRNILLTLGSQIEEYCSYFTTLNKCYSLLIYFTAEPMVRSVCT